MLNVADRKLSKDKARDCLVAYAQELPATVRYYDYAGDTTQLPGGSDDVVLADVGRLVIINARLSADDVAELLRPAPPLLWADVPTRCRLFQPA